MPELPDILVYVERLRAFTCGHTVASLRVSQPFVLRSVTPPLQSVKGKQVLAVTHVAKQIVLTLESDIYIVFHLMIAGRLHWQGPERAVPRRAMAALSLDHGVLYLTEAGKKHRASLRLVEGRDALEQLDRGGLAVLDAGSREFAAAMRRENHTLKRALTDQRIVSGIGNAYSDEILHRAKLSPFRLTSALSEAECDRLYEASVETLTEWINRLRQEVGDGFPKRVTAFREGMSVHGRYAKPCPVCGAPIQRIRYAENECNYCARCQTGDRILADRSLSRLLKRNWPRTLAELEDAKDT